MLSAAASNGFSNDLPHSAAAVWIWAAIVIGFVLIVVIAASIANHFEDRREGETTTTSSAEAEPQ